MVRRRTGPRLTRAALVAVIAAICVVWACAEMRRANGEACIKNEDCMSGLCSGLSCVALPPLLLDGGGLVDAAADSGAEVDAGEVDATDGNVDAADGAAQADAREADVAADSDASNDAASDA